MKVRVNFFLSETGQKAQAKAGSPAQQDQNIEMDLTHPAVLEAAEINARGDCRLDLYRKVTAKHQATYPPFQMLREQFFWDSVPTENEIAEFLGQQSQVKTEAEADLPRLQAEYDAKEAARIRVKAEEEAQRVARKAAEEAAAKEAKEAAEKGKEALKAWAVAHGSDLLRARLAGEFAWQKLAREEFVAAHLLEGYVPWDETPWATGKFQDWMSPGLEEIRERDRLEETLEAPYVDSRLLFVDDISEKYGTIAVDVVCPDGHIVTLGKWRIL